MRLYFTQLVIDTPFTSSFSSNTKHVNGDRAVTEISVKPHIEELSIVPAILIAGFRFSIR